MNKRMNGWSLVAATILIGTAACGGTDSGGRGNLPEWVNNDGDTGDSDGGVATDYGNPSQSENPDAQTSVPTDGTGLDSDTCAKAQTSVDRIRPRVVFLIDSSSSMAEDFGGPTRWDALRESLLADDGVVPELHELVKFGLITFAGPRYTTCPAYRYAAPAPANLGFVEAAFPNAPPDESSTPTGAAMDWAIDNAFVDQVPGPDVRIEPQYMIFATDGEPNGCAGGIDSEPVRDFDSVIAAAHKAAARGIKVFVVSLAEASGEFADHLAQVAEIGETGTVYSPQTRDDLVDELMTIIGAAISCEVELHGRVYPGMECDGEVRLNGEPLECNGPDGWELVDESHIAFKGAACEAFRFDVTAYAQARFPCTALQ